VDIVVSVFPVTSTLSMAAAAVLEEFGQLSLNTQA